MSRHRVGINLLWLSPGRVGGSEEYCVRLLDAFATRAGDHADLELRLFVNRRFAAHYTNLVEQLPTDVAPVDGDDRLRRILAEHRWLPGTCLRREIELVHHMGGTVPLRGNPPAVVLIHDLQPWAMPENFGAARLRYLRAVVPRSVRRAVAITTLSRWVQHDVHERLGVPLERMVLVPPGLDAIANPPDVTIRQSTLDQHRLTGHPFFLFPGITYRHKNHLTLVRAFGEVRRRHPNAVLVLTGGAAEAEQGVTQEIRRLGLMDAVRRTGRIPEADLDVLYRSATALTFPSRYEGFGMPVLEAMTRGCAVLASRACALPEVVDGGGTLLDPDDVPAWSTAMAALLDDPAVLARARSSAGDRALEFDWGRSVATLTDLYRRLAASGSAG